MPEKKQAASRGDLQRLSHRPYSCRSGHKILKLFHLLYTRQRITVG